MLAQTDKAAGSRAGIDDAEALRELRRRMQGPQRHRLLHGYPLAAAMPARQASGRTSQPVVYQAGRGLLVGVLPHPFCNPAVAGCGFCTFPHELFSARRASIVVEHVVRELEGRLKADPALEGRRVAGLYFGGGTANLTPPGPFRHLCRALARAFDLSTAEVTLEGVPAAFLNRKPLLVDILREELPARQHRLSMGIQTFDEEWLRRMGRLGFGTPETCLEVVRLGHARGFNVSGDLLFNLPGQSLAAMRDDVIQAMDLGLDHIGLYHLVMFPGLGTAWSRDPDLVTALPPNDIAQQNGRALRDLLEGRGFHQTTLTNFERIELRGNDRRFVYEELSFQPEAYDMLGLGPSGISFAGSGLSAMKVINPDASAAYVDAVNQGGPVHDRAFVYDARDLRVLHLTRHLAALRISRRGYRARFFGDPLEDFPAEFAALDHEGLLTVTAGEIRPSDRGRFFADSIAALLAWRQIRHRVRRPSPVPAPVNPARENDNTYGHM